MPKLSRLTAALFTLVAAGADRAAAQPVQLDEIVVTGPNGEERIVPRGTGPIKGYVPKTTTTGTKVATPLTEIPQSVSVVGAKQVRDLNQQTVTEALTYVSGIRADTFGADPRLDWFLIRGFAAQISGYYLDGLQLFSPDFANFQIEPFGLERLEVLKGPASVLYGGSNTGGIINAVSKRPTEQPHGYIETGINNFGNAYGAFDLSGPVSREPNNQFYYRLEGLGRVGGTQVNFLPHDRLWIAPALTWAPDAQTTITLLGQYQKDRSRSQNFLPYVGTVTQAPFGRIPTSLYIGDPSFDKFQRNQGLIGYTAEHRFNENLTVRQNLRYADIRLGLRYLYGTGYVDNDPASGQISRYNFVSDPHLTQFAVDNQVEGRFATGPVAHTALFGLDYKRAVYADSQGAAPGPAFDIFMPRYNLGITPTTERYAIYKNAQDQFGQYLQDQMKLGPLSLVLSGRHDMLNTRLDDFLTPSNSTTSLDRATTGRVGLIYTSPIGPAPYATYATSFDPQIGFNTSSRTALKPQTGQLEEVGFKYQPTPNLLVDGALFDLTQQNVLTTDPNNVFNAIQNGEQRSRGYEIEGQADLADGLKVLASYTGYRLRVTRDLNPAIVGRVPVAIPQNIGALFIDYTLPNGPLQGFGVGAGPRYVGSSYADAANTYVVPSYILADASIHFERERWRFALNVRNLLDKTYVASCALFTSCYYGYRRTTLFSLGYKW